MAEAVENVFVVLYMLYKPCITILYLFQLLNKICLYKKKRKKMLYGEKSWTI